MTACPSDERVAELAEGALSETERAEIEGHLALCSACARVVAELGRLLGGERGDERGDGDARDGDRGRIGRYELAAPLGSGGMGMVVEAWDPVLARRVAIKLVRPDRRVARDRVLAEARALAAIDDPHVLAIHDVIDSARGVCLVTERVDGEPADAWAAREHPRWPAVRAVYAQVARGLLAVHARGLLHRDVKPANVLVGRDGRARLVDFGLVGAEAEAAPGGTPGFMAPEQVAGAPLDARTNQFALGVAIAHALLGRVIAAGTSAAELRAVGLPATAARIVARMIAVAPAARYARTAEVVAALAPRRTRRLGAAIAGVALAGLAAGGIALAARHRAAPAASAATAARTDPAASDPFADALLAHDGSACLALLDAETPPDPAHASRRPICELEAGHCQAGLAHLAARQTSRRSQHGR